MPRQQNTLRIPIGRQLPGLHFANTDLDIPRTSLLPHQPALRDMSAQGLPSRRPRGSPLASASMTWRSDVKRNVSLLGSLAFERAAYLSE
jgi:hypothetical protein